MDDLQKGDTSVGTKQMVMAKMLLLLRLMMRLIMKMLTTAGVKILLTDNNLEANYFLSKKKLCLFS